MSYSLTINVDQFLTHYWHKKPTIIKAGFANFVDPISPDELAGLSMEEEIDSRFISHQQGQWSVEHGPFDDSLFANLPQSHWQLVVQACNHWHLDAAELVKPFQFLPQWLFDDLMVCYCAPNGGVGPHIDQYDVFIVQGSGQRHWQVGAKDEGQYQESIQAGALRQITGFDAIIDQVLLPGDILYIPAGFPHQGNTLEAGMSYSIGFRSPKERELLSHFADYVIANDNGDAHLHNPEMASQTHHGEIQTSDLEKLTAMLRSALQSEKDIHDSLGGLLSQPRHQLDIVELDSPVTATEIQSHLRNSGMLHKVSGLKTLYRQDHMSCIYINGDVFPAESECLVHLLCNQTSISHQDIDDKLSQTDVELIVCLVNAGFWYLS